MKAEGWTVHYVSCVLFRLPQLHGTKCKFLGKDTRMLSILAKTKLLLGLSWTLEVSNLRLPQTDQSSVFKAEFRPDFQGHKM